MKNNYLVYKHVAPNGKIYIGQTCQRNPNRRWQNGDGYKRNAHFYSAIQKYGWTKFEHVIIADGLTKKEANWLEKYLIAYYETTDRTKGYNNTKGGDGNFEMTNEVKRRMSESKKGVKKSDEHKKHLSEAHKRLGELYKNISAKRTEITDNILARNYDTTKSIAENLDAMKSNGIKVSWARLYVWAKKNGIKSSRNKGIATGYNPSLSIRENMEVMKCSMRQVIKARDEYNQSGGR